ncbi:serum response factor homolog isoform X1 [Diabrotica virgifera virgifera]|uniref:MADS-box domain-containing protein n=1 Tax=Diabrotica virgifera virgifera TaxID=50390 RepID=A0ABM5IMM4_DIAVI|nr:serum response factor homolog isoform X1 [Diabrotica virgifera virgifera]
MEPGGRDSRFNLGYSMNLLSGETPPEIYGNPNLGRPSTSLQQLSPRHTMVSSACNRGIKSDIYDDRAMSSQGMGLDSCVNEISDDSYSIQSKKSPPSNGKKTKGRVKIKMEYIENKLRRYTTFSKRKTGIMKKAYELSTLTGTQVMLLVASETGHVYTFATRKLQPMITSEAGKALIQTCLNSPDPPAGSAGGDQRMSATGFEETELTYNISDDDSKDGETGSDSDSEEMETTEEITNSVDNKPSLIQVSSASAHADERIIPNNGAKTIVETETPPIPKDFKKEVALSHLNTTTHAGTSTATRNSANLSGLFPLMVPSTTVNMSLPAFPTSSLPAFSTSSLPTSVSTVPASTTTSTVSGSENRVQALPLVLQTPAGMGYASTSNGMILGLLQGPNITQPQLVAIPMSSVTGGNVASISPVVNIDN